MTAIGFKPSARVELVLAENATLLVLGLAIGAGCALMGILPTLDLAAPDKLLAVPDKLPSVLD